MISQILLCLLYFCLQKGIESDEAKAVSEAVFAYVSDQLGDACKNRRIMLDINLEFEKLFALFEKQDEVPAMKLTEMRLTLPVPSKFLVLSRSKAKEDVCVPNTCAALFVLRHRLTKCPTSLEDLKILVAIRSCE